MDFYDRKNWGLPHIEREDKEIDAQAQADPTDATHAVATNGPSLAVASEALPAANIASEIPIMPMPRVASRLSDLQPVAEVEGYPIHPEHAKKLAAQLEALMGDFVALQSQVLAAGGLSTSLQARICKAFREPITGLVMRILGPYEKLSSGMAIGFNEEARVRLTVEPKSRIGISPENCVNTLRLDITGLTRYISLEFECLWSDVSAAKHFQLGIYGIVSRAVLGRAFLRFPATDGRHLDVVLAYFELGSDHRNFNRSGDVPYVDYVNVDTSKPPVLIFDVDTSQTAEFTWQLHYLSLYFD